MENDVEWRFHDEDNSVIASMNTTTNANLLARLHQVL